MHRNRYPEIVSLFPRLIGQRVRFISPAAPASRSAQPGPAPSFSPQPNRRLIRRGDLGPALLSSSAQRQSGLSEGIALGKIWSRRKRERESFSFSSGLRLCFFLYVIFISTWEHMENREKRKLDWATPVTKKSSLNFAPVADPGDICGNVNRTEYRFNINLASLSGYDVQPESLIARFMFALVRTGVKADHRMRKIYCICMYTYRYTHALTHEHSRMIMW